MNISEVAAQSGLPARTIRYYEQIDLVVPSRDQNQYRDFSVNDLHKLTFLSRARALGFTIEDCRALLALYDDKARASADVKKIAREHLESITRKIQDLQSMQRTLATLVESCAGDERPDCPILQGLSGADE